MLFSAWHAVTHAPQPVHLSRSAAIHHLGISLNSQLPKTNSQPLPISNSQVPTTSNWELGVGSGWELVVGSRELHHSHLPCSSSSREPPANSTNRPSGPLTRAIFTRVAAQATVPTRSTLIGESTSTGLTPRPVA